MYHYRVVRDLNKVKDKPCPRPSPSGVLKWYYPRNLLIFMWTRITRHIRHIRQVSPLTPRYIGRSETSVFSVLNVFFYYYLHFIPIHTLAWPPFPSNIQPKCILLSSFPIFFIDKLRDLSDICLCLFSLLQPMNFL